MICELQIIFGLDPIPGKLGVAREILEFLDHLHRIAARPAVDPVGLGGATAPARLGPVIIIAVVVAAATATALPVVHVQLKHPVEKLCQTPFGRPRSLCRPYPAYPAGSCPSPRSEEHTSELQSLMRISYAVFCLKKKKKKQ